MCEHGAMILYQNLFDVLGNDLTGEVLSFLHPTELLFSIGFVCKLWRNELAAPTLLRVCDLKSFDEFFTTKKGRSYIRLWIRMLMYDVAQQLQIHSNSLENHDIVSQMKGLEGCLENITFYLSHFYDLNQPNKNNHHDGNITSHHPSGGTSGLYFLEFLIGKIGAIFDYFKGNSTTNSQSTPQEPQTMAPTTIAPPPSKSIDRIKCIMEGKGSVGKTSFANCIMFDKVMDPLDIPVVIGAIDFKRRKYIVENGDELTIQIWDTGSRFRTLPQVHYWAYNVAFLMFDLTDRTTFLELKDTTCVKMFLEGRKHFEIVLIGNKVDVVESGEKKREVTKEEALEFANRVLGGALYVESTNANLKESSILGWYVMIHHLAMKCRPTQAMKMNTNTTKTSLN